ncbi:MAG: YceI family protein [Betaproteobacteria bacterium]|nr:YceI family protein [Betaproteobacteria bacterium]
MLKVVVLIAAAASLPVCAEECYSVDGSRGSVSYEVKQAGSPFRGNFQRFGGEVCLSAERATRMELWLDPASVHSGLPEIDAALKDKDFFAVAQYPRVLYTSQSVEARGSTQLAHGTLQIKGNRRSLDVPFSLRREGGSFVASGTLTLNRLDYSVGTGEWSNTKWLSGEVKVDFRATLSGK